MVLVLCVTSVALACKETTGDSPLAPVVDPAGTVSVSIRNSASGTAYCIDFSEGIASCVRSFDLTLDDNMNWECEASSAIPKCIVDVGAVAGVGSITSAPTTGYAQFAAAIPGHGYVVKDRYLPNVMWRMHATSHMLAASNGGVLGMNVRYNSLP